MALQQMAGTCNVCGFEAFTQGELRHHQVYVHGQKIEMEDEVETL